MALQNYVSERRLAHFKSKLDANGYKNKIERIVAGNEVATIDESTKQARLHTVVNAIAADAGAGATVYVLGGDTGNNQSSETLYLALTKDSRINDYVTYSGEYAQSGGRLFNLQLPTKDYVDNNAGKIDSIMLNSSPVGISNKTAYISAAEMVISGEYNEVGSSVALENEGFGSTNNHFTTTKTENGLRISANYDPGIIQGFDVEVTSKAYTDATFRTEAQVAQQIAEAQTGAFVRVDSYSDLPAEGQAGKIYLVPNSGSGQNVYDEYIWCVVAMVPGGGGESPVYGYEKIGTTAVDLSGYVQESDLVEITEAQIDAMFA